MTYCQQNLDRCKTKFPFQLSVVTCSVDAIILWSVGSMFNVFFCLLGRNINQWEQYECWETTRYSERTLDDGGSFVLPCNQTGQKICCLLSGFYFLNCSYELKWKWILLIFLIFQEDIFQQPGLRSDFAEIRDCLDTCMPDSLRILDRNELESVVYVCILKEIHKAVLELR